MIKTISLLAALILVTTLQAKETMVCKEITIKVHSKGKTSKFTHLVAKCHTKEAICFIYSMIPSDTIILKGIMKPQINMSCINR